MPIDIAGITDADLDTALANIGVLPPREQQQLLAALNELEKTQAVEKRQGTFLEFIDHVYPGYKVGNHHRRLAKIFEEIANGSQEKSYC
jgi:3-methyladenine DNA glycosylase Tag